MQAVHPAASLCRSKRLNGAVPDNTGPPITFGDGMMNTIPDSAKNRTFSDSPGNQETGRKSNADLRPVSWQEHAD